MRWSGQPPAQERQVEPVCATSVAPRRQGSHHDPPHRHPGGFISGVARSGQEQRGDGGWSAAQVLVLFCRHHLITDDDSSPRGAAIFCLQRADSDCSITGEQGEPWRLGLVFSPASNQRSGTGH